ncbi:CLC4D protein, partial [Serilophus lunatus]|nr:CLC4D protein [Serilophus lunatus]
WTCYPKGWKRFQKSCYFLSTDRMPWVESEQNCTGMGSHLVVINSMEEQLKRDARGGDYYIGLRVDSVGQWEWVDKTPYNAIAAFWRRNEPSDNNKENCVAI